MLQFSVKSTFSADSCFDKKSNFEAFEGLKFETLKKCQCFSD